MKNKERLKTSEKQGKIKNYRKISLINIEENLPQS